MRHFLKFTVLVCLGLILFILGALSPVYFRGVAEEVVRLSGERGLSLENQIQNFDETGHWKIAQLVAREARPGIEVSFSKINNRSVILLGRVSPTLEFALERIEFLPVETQAIPFNQFLSRRADRQRIYEFLRNSPLPAVQLHLSAYELTGFVQLFPARTAGGAALESAVLTFALAVQSGVLNRQMDVELRRLLNAAAAGDLDALSDLELTYLALLSFGQRLSWGELSFLLEQTDSIANLQLLSQLWREYPEDRDLFFSSLALSENVSGFVRFMKERGREGVADLAFALPFGEGALQKLFFEQKPLFQNRLFQRLPTFQYIDEVRRLHADWAISHPLGTRFLKAFYLFLGGSFLTSGLLAFARIESLRRTTLLRLTRNSLAGTVLALTAWILLEPALFVRAHTPPPALSINFANLSPFTLTSDSMPTDFAIDQITLLILVMFFLIQVVIYTFCLIKLSEIRRRQETPDVKIKLLENEEVLFDSGLYVGLGGTVSALIFLALNVVEASLMAAYASTLFGIIFVALLKIFHVRPYRQSLILQHKTAPTSARRPKPSRETELDL